MVVFYYVPAAVVLQLIGVVAEIPLYIEYRLTTVLRARRTVSAPAVVGEIAAAIAVARKATSKATKILVVLAAVVAGISIAAANGDGSGFLSSCARIIDGWWRSVSSRAGV